ncbi:MAG: TIGR00282 family metallophosphoesterase [Bryobacteraceae bacterium]|nr:TIGR00282 family metallophosphoesterase [Bryobacteraceae bacterium]
MRILFIGDVFGAAGRGLIARHLSELVRTLQVDLTIVNAENAAGGFGVTPAIAEELLAYGADVLTSGNHIWDKREIYDFLAREPRLLRPHNYPDELPGSGLYRAKARNGVTVAVINLQGRVYLPNIDCPFRKADQILEQLNQVPVRFVDFHAEVTSEKMALGWYLNGRVSALIGTHTHIPTADERILPGGTAYQTDTGMTGPFDSVIGVEKAPILNKFLTSLPVKMEAAKGLPELHGALVEVDETSGKAVAIERITRLG